MVIEAERDAHKLATPGMTDPEVDPHFPVAPQRELQREYLDLGSYVKVTRYGESMRDALLEALDLWAGRTTGRDAEAWLTWYLERDADEAP